MNWLEREEDCWIKLAPTLIGQSSKDWKENPKEETVRQAIWWKLPVNKHQFNSKKKSNIKEIGRVENPSTP